MPGLAADPVPADGQRLLPGMAGLAGAQHAATELGGPGGAVSHPMVDADPELGRVAAELLAIDPDGSRIGTAVRGALDMLLDGQHTGRYRWDQLCKSEKLVPNRAIWDCPGRAACGVWSAAAVCVIAGGAGNVASPLRRAVSPGPALAA